MVLNVTKPEVSMATTLSPTIILPLDAGSTLLPLPRLALLPEQRVDSLSLRINLVSQELDLSRQVVNRVLTSANLRLFTHLLLPAHTHEPSFPERWSLGAHLSALKIFDKVLLELCNRLVVILDHLGKVLQPSPDGCAV